MEFRVGDAYSLPFKSGTFDAVITEFVSQFLDREKAFKEFARVLKQGAYLGVNELYKEKEIPSKAAEEIANVEKIFPEITRLPFYLLLPEKWEEEF